MIHEVMLVTARTCLNSKQILGNASSPERLGQFKLKEGEETNMRCISSYLKGAAFQNLKLLGRGRDG